MFEEKKTVVLNEGELDYELGYLKSDVLITHHNEIKGQEEEGHCITIAEYDNGGKDIEWIIDKPFVQQQDAYDEEEPIKVYIKYTKDELKQIELNKELSKAHLDLDQSDYKAIKYFEGYYTEEEYQPIKEYRESLRVKIRQLEKELKSIGEWLYEINIRKNS
mgnify:CR=1 FL=1